jgi:hypothetical protein
MQRRSFAACCNYFEEVHIQNLLIVRVGRPGATRYSVDYGVESTWEENNEENRTATEDMTNAQMHNWRDALRTSESDYYMQTLSQQRPGKTLNGEPGTRKYETRQQGLGPSSISEATLSIMDRWDTWTLGGGERQIQTDMLTATTGGSQDWLIVQARRKACRPSGSATIRWAMERGPR